MGRVKGRVQKFCTDPSLTKQSFKDECDVNMIMKRFKKICSSDFLEKFNGFVGGRFGDFSEVTDYRSAIDQVRQADAVFGALPAIVRKRFDNNPALFLDFVANPNNSDELVAMGLATKRAPNQDAPSQSVSTGEFQ